MIFRAVLLLLWMSSACAAEGLSVEASSRGSAVTIHARALLDASYAVAWATLTDYNHLAQFIPGMRRSAVVEQRANSAVVEQLGEARFLFFTFPIEVTVESTSRPPNSIDIRVLKGNLKRLDGGYRIESVAAGKLLLRWEGVIEPEGMLPPLLGEAVMRANIEDQFSGMVHEIERRESARTGRVKAGGQ